MSKSDTFENDIVKLIFNATPIANLADNAATSPLTQLFFSLHTADPGETGTMATNEISYTSYARLGVNRNSGAFTVTGNAAALAAAVSFPACTGGTATATHFAIGVASSGAVKVLYKGALSPTIAVSTGVTPQIAAGTVVTED